MAGGGRFPAPLPDGPPPADARIGQRFEVTEDCIGCGECQDTFGCPALVDGGEDG
jgi:TPP-dependent indolepyruvate ferredoxin oxidoreductase alpha subunit